MEHTGFPSDETLAAFIDGRLDEETRKRVVEHLAECADCRDAWVGGREWTRNQSEERHSVRRWSRNRIFIPLAVAAAVIVAVFITPIRTLFVHPERHSIELRSLFASANDLPYRATDARLSGTGDYRPLEPAHRGAGDPYHDPGKTSLVAQWAILKQRAQKDPTPDNLHAFGVAAVLINDRDGAVTALEEALQAQVGEPDLHSAIAKSSDVALLTDLTASLSERAVAGNQTDALLAADTAERAWSLAKNPTTAWNRALAVELLHVPTASRDAWNDFLQQDSQSRWAVEARERLAAKSPVSTLDWERARTQLNDAAAAGDKAGVAAVVRRFPQEARVHAEDNLMSAWATDVLATSDAAVKDVERLDAIGDALAQFNGDYFVSDLAAAVRNLPSAKSRQDLARAVRVYEKGRDLHKRQAASQAIPRLQESEVAFRAVNCPLSIRAAVFEATAEGYAGHFDEAMTILAGVIGDVAASQRYPAALAQTLWSRGLIEFSRGKSIESLRDYASAVTIFERLGERENAAFLHLLQGQNLMFVGRKDEGWREYLAAVTTTSESASRRRAPLILGFVAREALDANFVVASGLFRDAALKEGGQDDPPFRVDALVASARAFARSGDAMRANQELARAREALRSIKDEQVRHVQELDLQAAAVEEGLVAHPDALSDLSNAIASAKNSDDNFRLGRFFFLRAKVQSTGGDPAASSSDYDAALATLHANGATVQVAGRRRWTSSTRRYVDDAVSYAVSLGDAKKALLWTEQARLRHETVDRSDSVSAAVSPGDLVLDFWITNDHLYQWAIARDGIDFKQTRIGRQELHEIVRALRDELAQERTADARRSLSRLYEILVRPFASQVSVSRRLIIVPDETIAGVPFSALLDEHSDQYLIERSPVVVTMTVDAARQLSAVSISPRDRATVVADPAFDAELLPSLQRLRRASGDADIVQRHFRNAARVEAADATVGAFEHALGGVEVLHFAGHSISNGDDETQSALVLAPKSGGADSGLLYASEIQRAPLHSVKLLILASCSSASGDGADGDFGPVARAFIDIGVPAVAGTLWDVRDGEHYDLMSAFYDALATTDVASALRSAQIERIRASKSLSWAAYELIGGAPATAGPPRT